MPGKLFCLLMIAVWSGAAQDIVLSKDALKVQNNVRSTDSPDTLTLINHGTEPVVLDSLQIQFEALEFTEMAGSALYIGFTEITDSSQLWGGTWVLDSVGESSYRYVIDTSRQAEREQLSINGSGDSIVITHLKVGMCPWCAALYFPAYLKGVVQLFYSNGQVVELRIVSEEDLREPVGLSSGFPRNHSVKGSDNGFFLINGQKVSTSLLKLNRIRIRHLWFSREQKKGLR